MTKLLMYFILPLLTVGGVAYLYNRPPEETLPMNTVTQAVIMSDPKRYYNTGYNDTMMVARIRTASGKKHWAVWGSEKLNINPGDSVEVTEPTWQGGATRYGGIIFRVNKIL